MEQHFRAFSGHLPILNYLLAKGKIMKYTFLVLFSILILSSCGSDTTGNESAAKPGNPDPEFIELDELDLGPILRDSLSREQEEQIEYLHQVFTEVNQVPLEKWKSDFQRDANPDKEIAIWMAMANGYTDFLKDKELSIEEKLEIYEILLVRSVYPEAEALASLDLKYLSKAQAVEVMKGYQMNAEPIRVSKED